jgi:large-conductance mechanosensitive channel
MALTPLNPHHDPFFPDWMYTLGMPHFNLYETELFNMLFELTIIAFILQFLYIELVVERRRRLKKKNKTNQKHNR